MTSKTLTWTALLSWSLAACGGSTDERSAIGGCPPNGALTCQCADGASGSIACDAAGFPIGTCQCGVVLDGQPHADGGPPQGPSPSLLDASAATDGGLGEAGAVTTDDSSLAGDAGSSGGSGQRSAGCGTSAPPDGEQSLTVGGLERRYILRVPPGYDPNRAYPLVFGFHGATSSAEGFQSAFYGGLEAPIGGDAVIVYGHAQGAPGETAWEFMGPADLDYFDAVLERTASELCIDMDRIFATGHSSGGFFSNRLGCARGDVLRAIAPLAGGGPFAFGNCEGQVAAWIEHGDSDVVVNISSGEGSRDHWVEANGCDAASPSPTDPTGCVAYAGCDEGYPVHWCVSDGGHNPRPSFTGSGAWEFFQSLP